MTTFNLTFTGQNKDLELFKVTGLRYYSRCLIIGNMMQVMYISETNSFDDITDCINLLEADKLNVELI